jgi:hypothetical protein
MKLMVRAQSRSPVSRVAGGLPGGKGRRPAIGDDVVAGDGRVGRVARLLRTESAVPLYMIVAAGRVRRRYPVIACDLITDIDGRVVRVRGSRHALRRLPESLPLVL